MYDDIFKTEEERQNKNTFLTQQEKTAGNMRVDGKETQIAEREDRKNLGSTREDGVGEDTGKRENKDKKEEGEKSEEEDGGEHKERIGAI